MTGFSNEFGRDAEKEVSGTAYYLSEDAQKPPGDFSFFTWYDHLSAKETEVPTLEAIDIISDEDGGIVKVIATADDGSQMLLPVTGIEDICKPRISDKLARRTKFEFHSTRVGWEQE